MRKKKKKKLNSNLDSKLKKKKKKVSIMKKNAEGHGYNFVDEESILLIVNEEMVRLGLKLTPRFVSGTLFVDTVSYKNSKGQEKTDVLLNSEMEFVWKDIETGEFEVVPWIMVGQQADGSQAMGSGLTYANRYFLLKYFNIATSNEDPDAIRSKIAKEEEQKKLSSAQTKVKKQLEKMIQKYQTQENIYKQLGTTKEQFIKDYNDPEKCKQLQEQMELLEKDSNNVKS